MEVEFKLTPEDLAALQRYHKKYPPYPQKKRRGPLEPLVWMVIVLVVFTLMMAVKVVHDPVLDYLLSQFPGLLVGLGLGFGLILVLAKLATRKGTLRSLEQGRNADKVLGRRRISIDERGIRVETEYSSLKYQWWGVDVVAATEDHAFLYFLSNSAFIVPRDAFRTDREFDAFVAEARRLHNLAGVGGPVRERVGDGGGPGAMVAPAAPDDAPPEDRIMHRAPPEGRRDLGS